jgi:hypothetical protein
MSTAWETTTDDVLAVLHLCGVTEIARMKVGGMKIRGGKVEAGAPCLDDISDILDYDSIEQAALRSNDMVTQTNYAYQEIESQLREAGVLPKGDGEPVSGGAEKRKAMGKKPKAAPTMETESMNRQKKAEQKAEEILAWLEEPDAFRLKNLRTSPATRREFLAFATRKIEEL